MYDNGAPKWHVHRDYPKVPIDIAVIEIEPKQLEGTLIKTLSREATPVTFFLGVFSATISKILPSRQEEPLGLGIVWYSNLIEQIIDDIRR